ncbi:MAG: LysR family transcriptional regulator [Burkholderiaceae bacterium]
MNIDIDESKFRRLDLNLLLVFSVMIRERSVTRAASKLFLGQPAVSAALSRLREATGDKLFVRGANGMDPTVRALQLAEQIKPALEAIEAAFFQPDTFDPATATRTFRIRLADSVEVALFPPLLKRLRETAPGLRFSLRSAAVGDARDDLDKGTLDLAIGVYSDDSPRYRLREVGLERFAVLYSPDHLKVSNPITLDEYLSYPHLLTSFMGGLTGQIDDVLESIGRERTVLLSTPGFLGMSYYLKSAPYVATMPRASAQVFANQFGLSISPVPVDAPTIPLAMLWHSRSDGDPALAWLVEQIADVARGQLSQSVD